MRVARARIEDIKVPAAGGSSIGSINQNGSNSGKENRCAASAACNIAAATAATGDGRGPNH